MQWIVLIGFFVIVLSDHVTIACICFACRFKCDKVLYSMQLIVFSHLFSSYSRIISPLLLFVLVGDDTFIRHFVHADFNVIKYCIQCNGLCLVVFCSRTVFLRR